MPNSKLYQPPPPPPRPKEPARDPLLVLSQAPPAGELVDLTDDEGLEEWAKGGTRIMSKPQSQAVPTMLAGPAPMPSFYPVAMNAQAAPQKKSSAAVWVAVAGLLVLAMGAAAAVAGVFVYRSHTAEAEVVTATTAPAATVADPATVTVAPTVTATATPTTTATATLTMTSTSTSTSTRHASTTQTGSIRTFAIGNGKPVYVDGKQVGVGGGKLTTACGHHTVAVGTGHAKSVDIPCNGSTITVGTPDGE